MGEDSAKTRGRPGTPGGKRERNRKRRLREIAEAGLALFLERGIAGPSIDDIVSRAAIAKGSFYRYFKDKEDLVAHILAPLSAGVRDAMARCQEAVAAARRHEDLEAPYRAMALALFPLFLEEQGALRLYLQEARGPARGATAPVRALADTLVDDAVALTEAAHSSGLLKPIHPRVSALISLGAIEKLLLAYLSGEQLGDPLAIPAALTACVLEGLRADP